MMIDNHRQPVLALLGCYWPENEATGPNQSFRSLAAGLTHAFSFKVAARAVRPGAKVTKPQDLEIRRDGYAVIKPCRISRLGAKNLGTELKQANYELLLLNGFFDREFTIPALLMRKAGLIPRKPTILSPRGEFAAGALSLKSRQKQAYIAFAKRAGLLDDIWLHATEAHEDEDIRRAGLKCRGVLEAPNPRRWFDLPADTTEPNTDSGTVRIAFVGRLTPVKNVRFALDVLAQTNAQVNFDLYGPVADPDYWAECEAAIRGLPDNIVVDAKGTIANERIPETLAKYDLFFLPTLGENFGHAINEALMSGLPVLISDKTPWRGLAAQGAGWDLPLQEPERFARVIDQYAGLSQTERHAHRQAARAFAERRYAESDAVAANRRMFEHVIAAGARV